MGWSHLLSPASFHQAQDGVGVRVGPAVFSGDVGSSERPERDEIKETGIGSRRVSTKLRVFLLPWVHLRGCVCPTPQK